MKTFAAIIVTTLAFAAMNTASAEAPVANSLTVQFADLDLNKTQGTEVLFKRIKEAAAKVCSPFNGRTLTEKRTYAACTDQALSTAIARVDRPVMDKYVASPVTKTEVTVARTN